MDIYERLNGYVPIVIYLAVRFNLSDQATKLLYYDPKLMSETGVKETANLMLNSRFVGRLMKNILMYEEHRVFDLLLTETADWEMLFSEEIINMYL